MPNTIKAAAIQMNAEPGLITERLARAEVLIARAAKSGAQLAVLPEMFNIGATYADSNYTHAEPADGLTTRWMKDVAARYDIHIAGSFILLDEEDIYNSMLLVAPDGRVWRYDKNYPWMWERAYFREGTGITVADTPLGKLGMMICWDIAHPELWERYAGKVDVMLISSCPPNITASTFILPDGIRLTTADAIPMMEPMLRLTKDVFGQKLLRQSSRMRVPVVATTGTGTFSTGVPLPRLSFLLMTLAYPILWRHLSYAAESRIEGGFYQETYVADAGGHVLDRVAAGSENYALAEIALADAPPQPVGRQPAFGITPLPYLLDSLFNMAAVPTYRRKVKAYFGSYMAPIRPETRRWTGVLLVTLAFGFVLGRLLTPRRVKVVKVPAPDKASRVVEPPKQRDVEAAVEYKPRAAKGDRREIARVLLPLAVNIGKAWLDRRKQRKTQDRD